MTLAKSKILNVQDLRNFEIIKKISNLHETTAQDPAIFQNDDDDDDDDNNSNNNNDNNNNNNNGTTKNSN